MYWVVHIYAYIFITFIIYFAIYAMHLKPSFYSFINISKIVMSLEAVINSVIIRSGIFVKHEFIHILR